MLNVLIGSSSRPSAATVSFEAPPGLSRVMLRGTVYSTRLWHIESYHRLVFKFLLSYTITLRVQSHFHPLDSRGITMPL